MNGKQLVAILGGVAIVAGSFMDWITATAGIFTRSAKGIDGDGKITVVLGLAAIVLLLNQATARGAAAVAVAAGAVTLYEVYDANERISAIKAAGATGALGAGLWLMLVGAVAVVAAAWSWHAEGAG